MNLPLHLVTTWARCRPYGKSIVSQIMHGKLTLRPGSDRLVAHDQDGVVLHEWNRLMSKKLDSETLK